MEAYITLLTNNNYASGALVLGYSLRAVHTAKQLAILITANVSQPIRDRLAQVYDSIIEIGEIDSHSTKNLALLGRPELGITLTKIHVFNQTQYSKVIFLDADTLVLRNIDELFDTAANGSIDDKDRNTRFAASPDAGWPDCFNSGVFVCRPKFEDYMGLIEMAGQQGTFDGGDQGLLNSYFDGWSRGDTNNRLPFLYNTTPSLVYSYAPAFQQYKDKLAVIHFVGSFKPWQWLRFADGTVFPRNTSSTDSIDLVQRWWSVFDMFVGGKPSDIHEVVHGYDLPPISKWDRIGMDRQVHEPEVERKPHYDGWFQLTKLTLLCHLHSHITTNTTTKSIAKVTKSTIMNITKDIIKDIKNIIKNTIISMNTKEPLSNIMNIITMKNTKNIIASINKSINITMRVMKTKGTNIKSNSRKGTKNHGDHQSLHFHHESHQHQQHVNPHHLTDYHYQPPPPPPVIPQIPEPSSHNYDLNDGSGGQDEKHIHHHPNSSEGSFDQEINPHHLTDYRYRLASGGDSSEGSAGGSAFGKIIPEPVGLPDMYYPNAWDLPEDPRKVHPVLEPTPLEIEDKTNGDNTPIPSGKGRAVFPWESSGSSTPRAPTRTYYNYAATAEERRRQEELEAARRQVAEEEALKHIRAQEHARYEQERRREEAHEQMTGSQAFENFRLVNAWDIDIGVQRSILQKTEKRKPRSRKSSVGGIRKGYGLEDMLAYEARQRQEQFEAELVRKRLEEEEKWVKEQEEARIREEELRLEKMRLEKLRLAEIARIKAEQRQKELEERSSYVFRNAWDPPGMALTKKKLRIEDEEVELALPLRQDRRSTQDFSDYSHSSTISRGDNSTQGASVTQASRGGTSVAAVATGAASLAIVAGSRPGRVQKTNETVSEEDVEIVQREMRSGSTQSEKAMIATKQHLSTATGAASESKTTTLLEAHGTAQGGSSTTAMMSRTNEPILTATKITTPGSQRLVRTTVTTTTTHKTFKDNVEVSSSTSSSTSNEVKRFEIPPGPRYGSHFGDEVRRTVSVGNSKEVSRLTAGTQYSDTHGAQEIVSLRHTTESSGSSSHAEQSFGLHESEPVESQSTSSDMRDESQRAITTTTEITSKIVGQAASSERISSDVSTSGSASATGMQTGSRKQPSLGLMIDTRSSPAEYEYDESQAEEQHQQRRLDLRDEHASGTAAAEAMKVLSRYPQATSRYATRPASVSSSTGDGGSSKLTAGGVLYASDPHLPRQHGEAYSIFSKGKATKTQTGYIAGSTGDDDEHIYQDEDLEELEYFGKRYTGAELPLGSPYMPSTPLGGSFHRYSASTSGYSSRAGSRPTTPGPGTPSRFGPGTPKAVSKRAFEVKQTSAPISPTVSSVQQTGHIDTGFSNYRIEWNWKELLGKKPRLWTAEAGEERYDPYSALSTHGSQEDSDDDRHILNSSDEDSDDDDYLYHDRSGSEGSSSGGKGSFVAGEDNDFTRESGFVIRDGKIARRRSSVALDRHDER
ncbi:Glycogenin-1 [Mortierella sp. AD010]|nr:Glycogenin-1 [Mortierella sp. AD010]